MTPVNQPQYTEAPTPIQAKGSSAANNKNPKPIPKDKSNAYKNDAHTNNLTLFGNRGGSKTTPNQATFASARQQAVAGGGRSYLEENYLDDAGNYLPAPSAMSTASSNLLAQAAVLGATPVPSYRDTTDMLLDTFGHVTGASTIGSSQFISTLTSMVRDTRNRELDILYGDSLARSQAIPGLAADIGFTLATEGMAKVGLTALGKVPAFMKMGMFAGGVKGLKVVGESPWLKEGLHHLDPKTIKFTQPSVSPNFTNGSSVNELISDLKSGKVSAYDLPPIQVVQKDGKLFSIDNRRLLAFNAAGVEKIPVEIVSLENNSIALKFERRFNPIAGQGNYAVVVSRADRSAALELLEDYNLIKRTNYGY